MAMAIAEAEAAEPAQQAQQLELNPVTDTGHSPVLETPDVSHLIADVYNSAKTSFLDLIGYKPDAVQTTASSIVNGNASWESVSKNLTDLKSQGKLSDLSNYFESNYSVSLRDQLIQNYPGRDGEIDKVLGASSDKPDPKLGGLSREQLQGVFDKFPALKGVISSPDVLGAMIQNEKDHTYDDFKGFKLPFFDDSIIDNTLRGLNRVFGDRTEWMSSLNPSELRAKAEKSGGIKGFFQDKAARLQERILSVSVGDGQVQIRNILALQDQERAAGREVPTITSSLTPEGSANLVGAYFTKSIQMLNDGTITDPSKNPFWKDSPRVRAGFEEAQKLWNSGDPVLKERAVMMTYNAGISNSDPEAWNPQHILKHYLGRK